MTHSPPISAPHLILIGPMGAGKTAIGRLLAKHFDLPFIDLDHVIEVGTGTDIATIFAHEGEAGFRRREREALVAALADHPSLIATGGGAVLAAENRQRMRQGGYVVHLHVEADEQLRRLARDHTRPLLQTRQRAETLARLAAERGPLYTEIANLRFEPTGMTASEAAATLAELLMPHWQPPPPAQDPRN